MTTATYCEIHDMDYCAHDPRPSKNQGSSRRHGDNGGYTKKELRDLISDVAEAPRWQKKTEGASNPAPWLRDVAIAVRVNPSGSMPVLGRRLVSECSEGKIKWPSDGDSIDTRSKGGSTISASGLYAILRAIRSIPSE